ncbi:MAG: hypothetical protein K0U64_09760 [Actinomycetia bacterium]|nr:hypothetical protein [Actinomycetes bacterium]
MVTTPLHLTDTGHSLTIAGVIISIHAGGTFLFAPIFGLLTDRISAQGAGLPDS